MNEEDVKKYEKAYGGYSTAALKQLQQTYGRQMIFGNRRKGIEKIIKLC